jgi:hypothetical protein
VAAFWTLNDPPLQSSKSENGGQVLNRKNFDGRLSEPVKSPEIVARLFLNFFHEVSRKLFDQLGAQSSQLLGQSSGVEKGTRSE